MRIQETRTDRCSAVDETMFRASNKQQRKRNCKRSSVAYETIDPPASAKGVGAGVEVKDEQDVDGHCQRPPRVRLHEPIEGIHVSQSNMNDIGISHV